MFFKIGPQVFGQGGDVVERLKAAMIDRIPDLAYAHADLFVGHACCLQRLAQFLAA